ncbi:hypothetical protein FACS189490_01600 [Clostridia bacterium]|nr:hypothetical protein FACS189490_01600 [Clostridia bacterium]
MNKLNFSIKDGIRNFKAEMRRISRQDPNIMVFVVYGLLYDVVMNLYKPFALKFLDRMGGTEIHISLYNSLPGIAAVLALLPGSIFISRFQAKKNVTSVFFAISRAFILMFIIVPFCPQFSRAMLFVLLVSGVNFFDAISQTSLQAFLGENFNGFTRATAISLRNKFGNMFLLIVTLVTGLLITIIPKTDGQRILLYQIFFAAAFVCGVFEIFVFRKLKEKQTEGKYTEKDTRPTMKTALLTLSDKKFKKYLALTILFYFSWHVGWPIGGVIQIKTLGANEMWLVAIAVASGLASFFAASHWAKIIRKKSNDFALFLAVAGIALNSFMYAFAPNMFAMTIANAVGGAMSIGVNIALLNGLLAATPDKDRVVYIAVYNTLVNVSLGLSPFVSMFLMSALSARGAMTVVGMVRIVVSLVLLADYLKNEKGITVNP